MFQMSGLPSGLIICNQSGKELLLVLLVKSEQLLAILHPSVFCSGARFIRTQCAQTFFTFKHSWIMHGLLHKKERCCHLQFIVGFSCVLCDDQGDMLHS
jgi:hypothetical protein